MKVRFSDFQTITRSKTLREPTDITQELLTAGMELLTKKLPTRHLPVRLLDFGVHEFDDALLVQRDLLDETAKDKQRQLDRVADQIAAKFGKSSIRRGAGLDSAES